jgi:leader peptidase (prepilin peptidase)/N-methyltransferase
MEDILSLPVVYYPLAFVIGLIVGSFLNVIIFRLPIRMEKELKEACQALEGIETGYQPNKWFGLAYLMTPASSCLSCGHRIRAWENIPVISWLLQKGRCTACGTHLSVQYPLVEFLTALLSLVVAWHFGFSWQSLAALLLTWALITMSIIDIKLQILPDVLILPLIWLGLILNLNIMFTDIQSAVFGAVFGYLSLWFIFHLFLLITGKEGMGYGDFKLLALFGAWFGWQLLPQILLVSAVVGAVSGIGMILFMGRDKAVPIPFGPYLAAAGFIAMLWGKEINNSYLQLAGIG